MLQTKAFPEDKAISNSIMGKIETQKEHTFIIDLRHKKRATKHHHQRRSFFESKNANDDDDDDDRAQNDDDDDAAKNQNGVDVESGGVWGET